MEDRSRGSGGRTALRVLAFIGVTLLLLVIALAAALFIATKGPSESAREAVYDWAAERNMQGIAGIFLSTEEKDALADVPGENPPAGDEQPARSSQPMIIISESAPAQSAEPESTETPGESPEESPETTGEEAAEA